MGIDIPSVANLPHVDRLHNESIKAPIVNQEFNAQVAKEDAAKRTEMAVEPDKADGKSIDPEDRGPTARHDRKRRKQKPPVKPPRIRPHDGSTIDVEA